MNRSNRLHGSLRRLKTDYVDILFVHDMRGPEPVHDEAIKEAMSEVKKEGKARFIGVASIPTKIDELKLIYA